MMLEGNFECKSVLTVLYRSEIRMEKLRSEGLNIQTSKFLDTFINISKEQAMGYITRDYPDAEILQVKRNKWM